MIWKVDALNALSSNSQNPKEFDCCVSTADVIFKKFNIKNIKQYGKLIEEQSDRVLSLEEMTTNFLAGHMDDAWEKYISLRRGFAFAVTAIMRGEKACVPAHHVETGILLYRLSWLFNLFVLLGDTEGVERLRYYFGTYTCPECGKRTDVLTGMTRYFLP